MTWDRFKSLYYTNPKLGLSLDISRMPFPDDFLAAMEPKLQQAFAAMAALEGGAIANPDENRMVGHYWLRAADLAAFSVYRPSASDLPMTVLRSDLRESTLCDPRRVWESLSPSMTLIDVPGNHMTMIRLPFLATLAERLSACVNAARANGVGRR